MRGATGEGETGEGRGGQATGEGETGKGRRKSDVGTVTIPTGPVAPCPSPFAQSLLTRRPSPVSPSPVAPRLSPPHPSPLAYLRLSHPGHHPSLDLGSPFHGDGLLVDNSGFHPCVLPAEHGLRELPQLLVVRAEQRPEQLRDPFPGLCAE